MIPATYRRILSVRAVRTPLIGATIGRLPFAAEAFATLLLVTAATGSFADAGLVNAAYTLALGAILTLTVVPLAAAPSLASAFPLMLISGVALAPTTTVIYLMLDFLAPEGTAAEATGWVLLAVLIGASTGNAAAGLAVNGSGPHAGLAVGLAGASLTTIVAWLGRRSLRRSGVTLAPQAEPVQ